MVPVILGIVVMFGGLLALAAFRTTSKAPTLTENLSVPLDGNQAVKAEINAGDGNLRIDPLTSGDSLLASGELQYGQKQGAPVQSLNTVNSQTIFSVIANKSTQRWSALPWAACNGATDWKLFLNPRITLDLTAHTDGGNIALNLAGMMTTRVQADTGGGNIDLILPDTAENLTVAAKTGAGNVIVRIPSGVAAKIHATTGLGKVIMDNGFSKIDAKTYQSPDYETAAKKIELTLESGAGNVSVITK